MEGGTPRGERPVDEREYLASQPPERRIEGGLDEIRGRVARSGRRVVVLDDDPTGVQSVHGVPVLTTWTVEDLRWALMQPSPTFYILTNSRSLPEREAVDLNQDVARNLSEAADGMPGTDFDVVSRSDSTLRGHYPAETDALAEALGEDGRGPDALVLCPAFFEAGRITVGDIHWVRRDGELVPAGQTEFAADHSFGYRSSNLKAWVEEKTGGRIEAAEVLSVSLADLREGGPERVLELLGQTSAGRPVVVNAATYADLEVFVLGLLAAEGKRFLYRTGPSFVRTRGGITEPKILGPAELYRRRPASGHGLVLVGSYVPTTTRQLEGALALDGVRAVEMSVPRLLEPEGREEELGRVVEEVNVALVSSEVVVYTSRELVTAGAGTGLSNFEIGASVSGALVEVMRRVDRALPLSFVLAKGGITSSDIATKGLGVRRAEVAGPLLPPGIVPVWILPDENDFPGLPYVIFPGNVGGPDSLAHAIEILRGEQ